MKTRKIALLAACLLVFGNSAPVQAAKVPSPDTRYFVKSTAAIWKNSLGVRHTFAHGFTSDLTDWQLRLTKIFNIEIEPVSKLSILPGETVEPEVSPASRRPAPGRHTPDAQVGWGIQALYGDPALTQSSGGKDVTVAVLDTGILKTHLDLVQRIVDCADFTQPKQAMVAGKCEDKNGHGTHVSGIIAADGGKDGLGMYGMAPEAGLAAYKVCDQNGSCWADDVAAAVRAAADAGVQVVNLSLGSDRESPLIAEAIAYAVTKNVLIVAAAGNDGPYPGSIDYPAAHPEVAGVGALNVERNIPDWSSRGSNSITTPNVIEAGDIEFAAPGVQIESAWKDGGYAVLSGTSMAAPHVAGLAAKLWPTNVENPASQVRELLWKLSQDVLPEGEDDDSGFGMPVLSE